MSYEEKCRQYQRRNRFIAGVLSQVFHDIRSPLNVSIGLFDYLTREELGVDEIKSFSKDILDSSRVLLKRINALEEILYAHTGEEKDMDEECSVVSILESVEILLRKVTDRKLLKPVHTFDSAMEKAIYFHNIPLFKAMVFELLYKVIEASDEGDELAIVGEMDGATARIMLKTAPSAPREIDKVQCQLYDPVFRYPVAEIFCVENGFGIRWTVEKTPEQT